jgi:threonine dehydrogenase-like Zn-dependent dehydrogenase
MRNLGTAERIAASMTALSKTAPAPGFELGEVAVPQVGPSDVLIRVRKAGICGTDHHIYAWDGWAQRRIKPPLVVGHEFVGNVAALGEAVRGFRSASASRPRATSRAASASCAGPVRPTSAST